MSIPGLCRVYARKRTEPYWHKLPHAPRCYTDCEQLVDYYQAEWGQLYEYRVTADHDLCAPRAVLVTPPA